MLRFLVTGEVPALGKVQHVIFAATEGDAFRRFRRAHPSVIEMTAVKSRGGAE